MVKILNYIENIIDFAQIDTPEMKRCLDYIKMEGKDPKSLFPPIKHKISFELHDANTELANSIRKCILDELTIKSMTFNDNDWASDDKYILSDFLKTNLEHIPINQDQNYDSIVIYLYKINTTDDTINIYSHDLVMEKHDKNGKIVVLPTSDYLAPNIAIIKLQSGKYIKISNIKIITGLTYENAGKFAAVSATEYEILDVIPLYQSKAEFSGNSSLVSNPSKFKIGYTTYGNISNPKSILMHCCDTLIERIQLIKNELELVNTKELDIAYFSNKMKIEQDKGILLIYIENESWSVGRLISKYCYLEDSNIPFVTAGIIHPSVNKCCIKIKHLQPIIILKKAIEKIIIDLTIIQNIDVKPQKEEHFIKKGKREKKNKII
jgi:DNA-directed RNA polymerase subunit L